LGGRQFRSNEEVEMAVRECLRTQDISSTETIFLSSCQDKKKKYISMFGNYAEK
jgi:hypothetical protein